MAAYGHRLIPHIIDDNARDQPEKEVFQVPNSSDPKDGWRVVTWKEYAHAINHVAQRIIETCGQPDADSFPAIAYIGPNDARYVVLMVAAIKAGYKALFISPRNSQEGQLNLFEETDCHTLCFPRSHHMVVQPWLEARPDIHAVEVGGFEQWFPQHEVAPVPYNKTFEQAEWDPVVVLHTSGSTGFPKPIIARVGMLAIGDAFHNLPVWQGTQFIFRKWLEGSKRQWLPMPLFHAAALYSFINAVMYWDTPVSLGIERPMSSDLVVDCLKTLDVEAAFLPPAILEDMSQDSTCIQSLKQLKFVIFGGGNLGREAGNRLVENGVSLVNGIAATEFAPFPYYYQPDPKLWQYFIINSEVFGVDWRTTAEEGVYEQVIVRQGNSPGYQGFFYTVPDDDEYFTKDLYRPHPTLLNHWSYHGRADDIIVFSNGEKLNPVTIEQIVGDHPQVKGALVVGSNKLQPAMLIEPLTHPSSEAEREAFVASVWSLVGQANKETVAHGQIGREFVALTHPAKPFPRAGKGTVQRAAAIKLYQGDIDEIYFKAGKPASYEAPRVDLTSEDALVKSIDSLFETRLGSPHLEAETDFFSAGVDSMQVINAARLLSASLEAAGHLKCGAILAPRVIYGNPTPRRLAQYLMQTVAGNQDDDAQKEDAAQQHTMRQLHEKYTRDLPTANRDKANAADTEQTVILTGSTGNLGSYLLDQMVSNPNVKMIICLNRANDGGAKQQGRAMADRGLTTQYTDKVEFHSIDISRSDLGLTIGVYESLLKRADRWIHNAWPVNFNHSVETFEPHVRGVRNVADFCTRAEKRVALVFVSSIGTADRWDTLNYGPVPERRLEDLSLPSSGYGRSKMVSSMILDDVAREGDFPAATVRMGQIGGPKGEAGVWNRQEWLPGIIASSLHLQALPSDLAIMTQVDWTPVEPCARLVLEVAGVAQKMSPADVSGYYHGVNPSRTTWEHLAPAVQEFYGHDRLPETVDFKTWVKMLETTQSGLMCANPGIKLIDSYRIMAAASEAGKRPVEFAMRRTMVVSPAMRSAQAVSPELMKQWCKQWGFE